MPYEAEIIKILRDRIYESAYLGQEIVYGEGKGG